MIDTRNLRKIRLTPEEHIFFNSIVVVFAAAVGLQQAFLAQLEGRALPYAPDDTMSVQGVPHVTGVRLYLRPADILNPMAKNGWPTELLLFEVPAATVLPPRPSGERVYESVRGFRGVTDIMMRAAFIDYYETVDPADRFGADRSRWPQVWRFGTIVRNALTHNGRIEIRNPNAAPESWRTITYGPADNGKTILFRDFAIPELLYLMQDMDAAK